MRTGQFSDPHRLYIESYLKDFVEVLDKGVTGRKLTQWKHSTASTILDSDQLSDLDTTMFTRKQWFEMIVRKFTNYRTQVYLKQNPHSTTSEPDRSESAPLFRFSSVLTGRQLFAKENSEAIKLAATQHLTSTGHGSLAASYQMVLKERWDELSDNDHLHWEEMAEAGTGDIEKNQTEFVKKMHGSLTNFCQGGLLGDTELLLFYAFREPASGDLAIGTIHGHSPHNKVNFGGSRTELEVKYGVPWATFAEAVIPRPVVHETSVIPRNGFGVPIFPSIDLNVVTPVDTRILLAEYWSHVWAHAWGFQTHPPLPWAEIAADPSQYYDTVKYSLPFLLAPPQTLNTLQTAMWGEYLVRTSSLFEDRPFVFYSHDRLPEIRKSPADPLSMPLEISTSEISTPDSTHSSCSSGTVENSEHHEAARGGGPLMTAPGSTVQECQAGDATLHVPPTGTLAPGTGEECLNRPNMPESDRRGKLMLACTTIIVF
ncbi:hypothetical protein DFH09DRAFT_1373387 [Mycena vulgaris]|nr:hypothetical protein DFH09DRAFT_1380660 [Mycena vulgaris]KAJ6518564.1 hypothetical protein DFH09DRAFT_1373387 [Mycena vulgaris]